MSIEKLTANAISLLKNLIETKSFSQEEENTATLIEGWFNENEIIKPILDSDPLTFSQEEFNNNDVKTEQESEEKIESEKIYFDFEINDDTNAIKTELADEESEEIPVLEVRTDFYKKKGTTDRAGSSCKNKKKEK